ncbi:MAG: DUF2335 domain-containing protein [Lachnospiraceae bacterium]|nr:DUF2335 domain-containing protein [Lachnospiraceae bacterium]
MLPGTATRIFEMVEEQAAHRRDMEKKSLSLSGRDAPLGIVLTINIKFSTYHLLSQTLHKFIKFPSQFPGILIITKRPITLLNKLFFILQPAGFPRSYRLLPFLGALFTVFDFTIILT